MAYHSVTTINVCVLKKAKYIQGINSRVSSNDNMASDLSTPLSHTINHENIVSVKVVCPGCFITWIHHWYYGYDDGSSSRVRCHLHSLTDTLELMSKQIYPVLIFLLGVKYMSSILIRKELSAQSDVVMWNVSCS